MDFDPFKYKISDLNKLSVERGLALVSEPFMQDPYFKRSVILIAENNEEGTVGFNLTQTLDIKLEDLIDNFPKFDSKVGLGGPVQAQNLFFVHSLGDRLPESQAITEDLYWSGDFEQLIEMIRIGQVHQDEIRFFLGYSGWGKGQLDQELKDDSWFISTLNKNQVLHSDSNKLWREVIRNSSREISYMANFPEDPNLN